MVALFFYLSPIELLCVRSYVAHFWCDLCTIKHEYYQDHEKNLYQVHFSFLKWVKSQGETSFASLNPLGSENSKCFYIIKLSVFMAGRNNAMRRAPVRLTPQNSKAFLRSRQLQRGYRARIHQLKPGFLKTSQAASVPRPLHEFQPRMPVDLLKYFGIRVGDLVQIRFGPDRNKKGVVLETLVNRNRVIVEGCGMVRGVCS